MTDIERLTGNDFSGLTAQREPPAGEKAVRERENGPPRRTYVRLRAGNGAAARHRYRR